MKKVKSGSPLVRVASPTRKVLSPPTKVPSPPLKEVLPSRGEGTPPRNVASPPMRAVASPPTRDLVSPPNRECSSPPKTDDPSKREPPPSQKDIASPPASSTKLNKTDSKGEDSAMPRIVRRDSFVKEAILKTEKLSLITNNSIDKTSDKGSVTENNKNGVEGKDKSAKGEESNGVGDKIKKFEKAAEDANVSGTRTLRGGSGRGRALCERLSGDELPPPATPFKDNVHFDLGPAVAPVAPVTTVSAPPDRGASLPERQQSASKNNSPNSATVRWQRSDSAAGEPEWVRPEPQKIVKPEFKPMPSQVDVTIRSPSLGSKIGDQFPSHGTAFRNVASPDLARSSVHKFDDDVNTQNNFKACKLKNKEKYSVSKGSSYFTRGSEEIWLVKKKDIEEIEERVLDSFRRAGGNICMRSESTRASSEGGAAFPHGTTGRGKRQAYTRSESLDPGRAARAHTLKRQSSVACTCGHDKKTRAKSATEAPRPRSRSHGDDAQTHVLDKYETLV